MAEKKGLSHDAYGGVQGKDYVPYIPADEAMPEITTASLVIGCLFAILFGAANTYLGLKVGLTISASIPGVTALLESFRNLLIESFEFRIYT